VTEPSHPAQIAAAESFEALFVASEFAAWAPRVADAAAVASGQRVLDVACGTGALARHVSSVVGPAGAVAGIDIDAE
jgi:ubiquinone/menaquinone biosynthesis C-methylase UbiE